MEFSKAQNLMGCYKTKLAFDLLLKNVELMLSISRELLTRWKDDADSLMGLQMN